MGYIFFDFIFSGTVTLIQRHNIVNTQNTPQKVSIISRFLFTAKDKVIIVIVKIKAIMANKHENLHANAFVPFLIIVDNI